MNIENQRLIYSISYHDKIIYIGQTKVGIKKRIKIYKGAIKDKNKKTYIINFLRKHFNECCFDVLYLAKDEENLNQIEIEFIKRYNTLYPNGLNLTEGGESPVLSQEAKRKMSNSRLGKAPWNKGLKGVTKAWNKGLVCGPQSEDHRNKKRRFSADNHFFGKHHNQESKNKISQSKKGNIPQNRSKIYGYFGGDLIYIFSSIKIADSCGFRVMYYINNNKIDNRGIFWSKNFI